MTRYVGIDYGTRRIGLALADPTGLIASPATTLSGANHAARDADAVLRWAADNDANGFVIGLPLSMDGTDSAQTRLTRQFADELRRRGAEPLELWDERLSSFHADELMQSAGIRRAKQKHARDAIAAQVILQSFLDAQRAAE